MERLRVGRLICSVAVAVALPACGGDTQDAVTPTVATTTSVATSSTTTTASVVPSTTAGASPASPATTRARPPVTPAPRNRLLVFSRTTGFRHTSIGPGIAAVRELGGQHQFDVEATEDPGAFTRANLARFRAVMFLSTTGDVLDAAQEAALEGYVRGGGGFVGVHSATDTEYEWPFYEQLVGARFKQHPAVQLASIVVRDTSHPSTRSLPAQWVRTDEWYDFRTNPRALAHVLLTLDESTYQGGTMGADHPIAWCRAVDRGRSWYTAGGHTDGTFAEPLFRSHLLGGITYALGTDGTCA